MCLKLVEFGVSNPLEITFALSATLEFECTAIFFIHFEAGTVV